MYYLKTILRLPQAKSTWQSCVVNMQNYSAAQRYVFELSRIGGVGRNAVTTQV